MQGRGHVKTGRDWSGVAVGPGMQGLLTVTEAGRTSCNRLPLRMG